MRAPFSRKSWLLPCAIVCVLSQSQLIGARAAQSDSPASRLDREHLQSIVSALQGRLGIPAAVSVRVSIVPVNPLLASVTSIPDDHGAFLLSLEERFAESLSEDELTAALAHELGHVWIFTHFPYLQTEELANEIASRVVNRESLAPVYAKVESRITRPLAPH